MPETVITIVAARDADLTAAKEREFLTIVKGENVERLRMNSLHTGKVLEITLEALNTQLTERLRNKFQNFLQFDVFFQEESIFRKKKLLVADMDATMIEGETLDELAGHLGLKDQIAPITAAAMRGEIDFHEALTMRVKLLAGLPSSALQKTLDEVRYSKGAESLVKTMNRYGGKCVLISGGFDMFTAKVAGALGFYKHIGNRLGVAGDKLTGEVIPPIVDKLAKKKTVEDEARLLGIDPRAVVAVGDGANDIPMLQAAGAGVGYYGKPAVQAATPHQIRYTDLTSILYMQGYRREEFAA